MENFLVIIMSGFCFLIKHDGSKTTEEIEVALLKYDGKDDTCEESIENVLNYLGVKFEILPCSKIEMD